jgi:hypothetical protein
VVAIFIGERKIEMSNNIFKLWLHLSADIAKKLPNNSPKCPSCGYNNIDFQYVGDEMIE